jgi:hypothetical protein
MHHQSPDTKAPWATVPMGPALSKYLGVDPATQVQTPQDGSFAHGDRELASTSQDQEAARNSLILHLRAMHSKLPSIEDGLIADLVDELVTMAIPEAALDLARFYPTAIRDDDFRMQLAIGVAAMMVGELATSEVALIKAQSLLPNEPAPYVNLAQIFRSQDRLEEAEVWCLAGLRQTLTTTVYGSF